MNPQISIENSIGNIIKIQNDFPARVFSYLTRDLITGGPSTISVENTSDFSVYSTSASNPNQANGTQTWTVGSTANMSVGQILVTTGGTTPAKATITSITNATTVVVNVTYGGTGTATGVAMPNLFLINKIGSQNCELVSSVTTPPSKYLLSLASNPTLTHNSGEIIQEILYNKINIFKSSTINGTYTYVATVDPEFTSSITSYNDMSGASTDYYKIYFLNSLNGLSSPYSNPFSATSFTTNTAGALINDVKVANSIQDGDVDITDTFLLQALNQARQVVNVNLGYGKRNEWRQMFNYPIKMLAGTNFVNLPSDIDFSETDRSLLNVKYSSNGFTNKRTLTYLDKTDFNSVTYNSNFSETTADAVSGATTLTVTNSGDFPASGQLQVATNLPTESVVTITYTGNNLNTNTLTGVTGLTRNIAMGTQLWSIPNSSLPNYYTVWNGKLYFDKAIPSSLQGRNCYIDYYKTMADLSNLSDTLPEHYRNIYKDYLRYAIKKRRDDSIGEEDPDYKLFITSVSTVFGKPHTGQTIRIRN